MPVQDLLLVIAIIQLAAAALSLAANLLGVAQQKRRSRPATAVTRGSRPVKAVTSTREAPRAKRSLKRRRRRR